MKTDQLMTISIMNGEFHIYHNTAMGNLSELFKLGNTQRMIDGKGPQLTNPPIFKTRVRAKRVY